MVRSQGTVMERVKGEKLIIFRRKRRKTQKTQGGTPATAQPGQNRKNHSLIF